MARTLKCNLTGRAAATNRAEIRQDIQDQIDNSKRKELDALETAAMLRCVELEGEEAFIAWYEDDQNVPPSGPTKERIDLILKRIENLLEARYTLVDRLVGDECADPTKIADIAESIPRCSLGHDLRG